MFQSALRAPHGAGCAPGPMRHPHLRTCVAAATGAGRSTACQHGDTRSSGKEQQRRRVLQLLLVAPSLLSLSSNSHRALAEEAAVVPDVAAAAAATAPAGVTVVVDSVDVDPDFGASAWDLPFLDLEFQVEVPPGWRTIETEKPPKYDERGPAPERSPLRARFEAPDGYANVSVVVRNAAALRPTLLQVTDITAFGDAQEAAKVLLPPNSRVLSATVTQTVLPPRDTSMGLVTPPPKTYYTYEFTTPNRLHVALTAAAHKGRVYVAGASTTADRWPGFAPQLLRSAKSFHLRDGKLVM